VLAAFDRQHALTLGHLLPSAGVLQSGLTYTQTSEMLPVFLAVVEEAYQLYVRLWEEQSLGRQHLLSQMQIAQNMLASMTAMGYQLHEDFIEALPEVWFDPEGRLAPEWKLVHPSGSLRPTATKPALLSLTQAQRQQWMAPAGSRWWGVRWTDLEMRLLGAQCLPYRMEYGEDGSWPPRETIRQLLMEWFGLVTPDDPMPVDERARLDAVAAQLKAPLLDAPLTAVATETVRSVGVRTWARLMQEAAVFMYQRAALVLTQVQAQADSPRTWRGFDNFIITTNALYFTLDDRIPPEAVAAVLRQLDVTPWGLVLTPEILMGASWGSLTPVNDAFADVRAQLETPAGMPVVCGQCGKIAASQRDLTQHEIEEHHATR
jgi:hypothetical protein